MKRSLILFGLLISLLFSFDESLTPTKKFNPFSPDTIEFNSIMNLWNSHRWEDAKLKFEEFLGKYPESPWSDEAKFHLGCLYDYRKEYNKAIEIFDSLSKKHGKNYFGNKARIRLAGVLFDSERYNESLEVLKEILENNPTPSQYKYAFSWYRRIKRYLIAAKRANLCGPRSLAYCFRLLKKEKPAIELFSIVRAEKPYSFEDLIKISNSYDVKAYGVFLKTTDLTKITPPAILYLKKKKHFVVFKDIEGDTVFLIDPFSGVLKESIKQLEKEWSGESIIFSDKDKEGKILLSATQLKEIKGGCCGRPRPVGCLGECCEQFSQPGLPLNGTSSGGCMSGQCGGNSGSNGYPDIRVNMGNLNVFITTEVFTYDPGIGPEVSLALNYNTDDPETGIFGNSIRTQWDTRIYEQPDGSILFVSEDGTQIRFPSSSQTVPLPLYKNYILYNNGDGTYTIKKLTGERFIFGSNQKIAKIEDKNGNAITFQYDSEDKLIKVSDALGRITQLNYNSQGKVSSLVDPFGRTVNFTYDTDGNLIQITDITGKTTSFSYDSNNNIISITSPKGTITIEYLNPFWEQYEVKITDPLGNVRDFFWDGSATSIGSNTLTTPDGKKYTYYVDYNDTVNQITDPLGNTTYYYYDENKRLTQKIDPLGRAYIYSYDSWGNLYQVIDPKGKTTIYTYDENHNLTSITNPLSETTYFVYDSNGNLIKRIDPLGNTTTYQYNSYGKLTKIIDPRGNTTTYEYTPEGYLSKIIDPKGYETTFEYDVFGRKISQTDAKGNTTYYEYDDSGRVKKIIHPDGTYREFTYDCCSLTKIKDENGNITNYQYDALGRLTSIIDAKGNQTTYTYDVNGRLSSITDPKGNTITFQYDDSGRLVKKTYPDGSSEKYEYDANGNLIKKIKPDGKAIIYTYDELNRVIKEEVK